MQLYLKIYKNYKFSYIFSGIVASLPTKAYSFYCALALYIYTYTAWQRQLNIINLLFGLHEDSLFPYVSQSEPVHRLMSLAFAEVYIYVSLETTELKIIEQT